MPRRLIWFLISLALVLGFGILGPILDRMGAVSGSVNTSLSVSPYGYKALYLLLQRLESKPVSLWQHSMMNLKANPAEPRTIWFMEPGKGLFFDGENYARHMRELVEQGNHLIFAVDGKTLSDEESLSSVIASLNRWYGLSLKTGRLRGSGLNLSVRSYFPNRNVNGLSWEKSPVAKQERFQPWPMPSTDGTPVLSVFTQASAKGGDILMETRQGEPLILRFPIGRGSVTVFADSFYLGNGQLDRADNAPLAMALQELNDAPSVLFEVYSSGFNENRDFLTYLATGKGIALLITLLLMLIGFCVWVIYQPIRKINTLPTSDERYFTQEVFIDSLAMHYVSTQNWYALYQKLVSQFRRQLDRRYPGMALETQLECVARNPFFDVSHESLKGIFAMMKLSSQSDFIARCQRLLEVQRKVSRYEQQSESRAGRTGTAGVAG